MPGQITTDHSAGATDSAETMQVYRMPHSIGCTSLLYLQYTFTGKSTTGFTVESKGNR